MQEDELISVVMASYNHAPYVIEAVNSVLQQEGVRLELLIEDDASSDGSHDLLQNMDDPRVEVVCRKVNHGACSTVNNLIGRARGDYIALINSDDVWSRPDKLRQQLAVLQARPELGAVFAQAAFIDAQGNPLTDGAHFYGNIFRQENRTQGQWLRRFFFYGNCLCHPSMLIRKRCYQRTGLYNNRLRQLPDQMMWIELVKHYGIWVSDEVMVNFRILGQENASAPTSVNAMRSVNEQFLQYEHFWEGVDAQLLREGFLDLLTVWTIPTHAHLDIEQCLLFFKAADVAGGALRLLGLQRMYGLLASPGHRAVLSQDYGITDAWLHRELGAGSPFSRA
jgi:glycosyltransferase involved in cell wall biosynthesis